MIHRKMSTHLKKAIHLLASALALVLPQRMPAHGTIYLSNLSQPSRGREAVASDSWFAGIIRTGTNSDGYGLNSIQLLMDSASGSPSGFDVMLYGANGTLPGNGLGNLIGSDPAAGGLFNYTGSGILLSPSTLYVIVLTAASSRAQGSYHWSLADAPTFSSIEGWFLGSGYYSSSDGLSWAFTRPFPFQFAVDATVVPEPESWLLVLLGLAGLRLWRHPFKR